MGCKPGVVKVFDSMRTSTVCNDVREAIASILHTSHHSIQLAFPNITQQNGSCGCELFSLAYTYTAYSGEEPSSLTCNPAKLRKHLKSCIDSGKIKPFPSSLCQRRLHP